MINRLRFHNFKSWSDTGDIRLSKITGLFGGNSSGKTSIMQLLLMLKQTAESPDRTQVLNLGSNRTHVELGTFKDILYNHASSNTLKFKIDWIRDKLKIKDITHKDKILFEDESLGFQSEIVENGSGRLSVTQLSYIFANLNFKLKKKKEKNNYSLNVEPETAFKFIRTPGRVWDLPAPVKCYGFPDQIKAYYQNAAFLSDFQLAFEELFGNVYYLGPLREYPKRQYTWGGEQPTDMGRAGERVVDAILASQERKKISRGQGRKPFSLEEYVAHWLRELGLIHSFRVEAITPESNLYQVKVKKTSSCAEVLITDVGFGVSQILPVLTLCYYVPEGSTVLLEQPEIHLHPSVQAGLADVFIDAIKTRKIQIILESHSEHLLRRLQRRISEEEVFNTDTSLYFCEMKDGKSELIPLALDLYGRISNWPDGFFGDEFGEIASMNEAILQRKSKENNK